VGVYGMSTTLTKEGVQLLKDVVSSPKESLTAGSADSAATTVSSGISPRGAVIPAEDAVGDNTNKNSGGRWLLSWFSSRANRTGKGNEDEPT